MATSNPTSVPRAAAALDAVRPDLNRAARQMLLGQAKNESDFGNSLTAPKGVNSNNWGNIYAKGDLGTIPSSDTFEGKPISVNAAFNSTPEAGAKQFSDLVINNYKVLPFAENGDAWGYARALWRDGPGTSKPSYYGGFPVGHQWSLAPKGTEPLSPQDYYYRVLAYAKYVMGGAQQVAKALGETSTVFLKAPPPPEDGEELPGANYGSYEKDNGPKSKPIESGSTVKQTPKSDTSIVEDLGGDTRATNFASKASDALVNASKNPGVIAGVVAVLVGGIWWILKK
jgi:hypothetical protein